MSLTGSLTDPAPARGNVRPGTWVPTSYLAEGIPFAMAIWVAGTMFKDLGRSDAEITVGTASVGIAWSLKPFWAPLLDMARTKKFWVVATELAVAAFLGLAALALRAPDSFTVVLAILWAVAFAGATQDIAVDGIYVTALDRRDQASWIGAQGMSWNGGRIFATAAVVGVAGLLKSAGRDAVTAWMGALGLAAVAMALLGLYHARVLPEGAPPARPESLQAAASTFLDALRTFLAKKSLWGMLIFVLLYRTGEGFLLVEAPLFLQASTASGGLGLSLAQKSLIDGTVSTLVSIGGGLVGGVIASRVGLRRTLLPLAICLNVPHLCYYALSHMAARGGGMHPPSEVTVYLLVSVEKLGYSIGFVGNMLYMMQQIAPGPYPMTHYAFATALMNLVLVPTQMASGPLAGALGYERFFLFVIVASIPSLVAAAMAPFPKPDRAPADG
jgi:MFS transporter, PAT family, beta-lactamase induction signal transducer AmpG